MKAKTGGGSFSVIAKKKYNGNLIKILCVLLGAVFALSTSYVFAAVSWARSHNSGYATGTYLPNQSYQIINDTLPNGVPYAAGAKEYEVALQYSYDYDFYFYVEYSLVWVNTSGSSATTTNLDSSNVILTYSNRDAWIVDNSRIYYREQISAGTGKLPIIVGVDFANLNDETYYGHSLQIKITNVTIAKSASDVDKSGIAGGAWGEYQTRKLSSYTGTTAHVVVYNPTDKDGSSCQPKAPVGKTAFRSGEGLSNITQTRSETSTTETTSSVPIKEIWGNKNYVGLGIYVITGSSSINLKAKLIGSWLADDGQSSATDVYIVSNTIKYDFADGWENETYSDSAYVQEIRTYTYSIPAHTAAYIPIVDSVELTTRGFYANADYSNFHIRTQLDLNDVGTANITMDNGVGTATISTVSASGTIALPTSTYSVYNRSKFDAALFQYQVDLAANVVQRTNVVVVNNTANKLSVSASYKLKVFVSNGNSTATGTSGTINFEDSTYWARKEETLSNVTVDAKSIVIAPYSAATICTQFTVTTDMYAALTAIKDKYSGSDVWCVLVPTITASTSTAADSRLVLQTEVVNNKAQFYVKNVSTSVVSACDLSVKYDWLNAKSASSFESRTYSSQPANWERVYWKYYTLTNGSYTQLTRSGHTFNASTTYYLFNGWQAATSATTKQGTTTINPGEKIWLAELALNSSQIYDFSNATLTSTVASSSADVQLLNETTGLAYLINKSTTKSYYVRFNGTTSSDSNFFTTGGYSYFYGLIRPGQVIPIKTTASTSVLTVSTIEDTTGKLLTSAEFTAKGWADVRAYFENMYK